LCGFFLPFFFRFCELFFFQCLFRPGLDFRCALKTHFRETPKTTHFCKFFHPPLTSLLTSFEDFSVFGNNSFFGGLRPPPFPVHTVIEKQKLPIFFSFPPFSPFFFWLFWPLCNLFFFFFLFPKPPKSVPILQKNPPTPQFPTTLQQVVKNHPSPTNPPPTVNKLHKPCPTPLTGAPTGVPTIPFSPFFLFISKPQFQAWPCLRFVGGFAFLFFFFF